MKPFAAIDFELERRLDKKGLEANTIEGFVARLGFTGVAVTLGEQPDATIDLGRDDDPVRIGCELQRLYSDGGDSGSDLQRFRGRWQQIMEEVLAELRSNGSVVPYCVVDFRSYSYVCLAGLQRRQLVAELILAGTLLKAQASLEFPRPEMPVLSSTITRIRVIAEDGEGMLWWPSHLRTGPVPEIDEAVLHSIERKCAAARQYDWRGASEKWLLLFAQAHGLYDLIGAAREFETPAATDGPFTMILVWDKFSEDIWAIHPNYAVICDGAQQRRHIAALPPALRPFIADEHYATGTRAR